MVRKITVVGAGVSGRALALFAAGRGAKVFVTDSRAGISRETEEIFRARGIEWETGSHSPACCECDAMVLSSGVPPTSPAVLLAKKFDVPLLGELDFLAPFLRGEIIAVTGTNGKTTCATMIAAILRANGLRVALAGNIGDPLATHAGEEHDALVAELSSFQLHWSSRMSPDVAVLTNLAPDHIDWHGSYENYVADKCRIFLPKEGEESFAVVHARDAKLVPAGRRVCALGDGGCISPLEDDVTLSCANCAKILFKASELRCVGRHNIENAAMSAAAAVLAFPRVNPRTALASYQPPRHRLEKVATRGGVLYIDDSKATNVAAAVSALRSIRGRKIIILGGQGKGESYEALASSVKENAASAIIIGAEAPKIVAALRAAGYENAVTAEDMADAVKKASRLAHEGDCVLLSPACTSWDAYKNYEERGEHFAAIVRGISARE